MNLYIVNLWWIKVNLYSEWYPLVMTNSSPWYRWPREIDGLPVLIAWWFSMAMLNNQRVHIVNLYMVNYRVNYRVNIWISGLGLGFWLGKLKFVAIVFTNCESKNINLTRSRHCGWLRNPAPVDEQKNKYLFCLAFNHPKLVVQDFVFPSTVWLILVNIWLIYC